MMSPMSYQGMKRTHDNNIIENENNTIEFPIKMKKIKFIFNESISQ